MIGKCLLVLGCLALVLVGCAPKEDPSLGQPRTAGAASRPANVEKGAISGKATGEKVENETATAIAQEQAAGGK